MILVTGASGYLGINLSKMLMRENLNNVKYLIRSTKHSAVFDTATVCLGDILDEVSLDHALSGVDTVIHIAAVISPVKLQDYERVNVTGTLNLMKSAKRAGVKKIIFISSYDAIATVETHYGRSKRIAEQIIIESGLDYVIFRPTVIYGGINDYTFSKIVSIIKRYHILPIIGDGEKLLQPVFVNDLTKIIISSTDSRYKNCIYNVGGPESMTLKDIASIIFKQLDITRRIIYISDGAVDFLLKNMSMFDKISIIRDKLSLLSVDKSVDNSAIVADFEIKLTRFSDGIKSLC